MERLDFRRTGGGLGRGGGGAVFFASNVSLPRLGNKIFQDYHFSNSKIIGNERFLQVKVKNLPNLANLQRFFEKH